jgi:hypothetical protein
MTNKNIPGDFTGSLTVNGQDVVIEGDVASNARLEVRGGSLLVKGAVQKGAVITQMDGSANRINSQLGSSPTFSGVVIGGDLKITGGNDPTFNNVIVGGKTVVNSGQNAASSGVTIQGKIHDAKVSAGGVLRAAGVVGSTLKASIIEISGDAERTKLEGDIVNVRIIGSGSSVAADVLTTECLRPNVELNVRVTSNKKNCSVK